MSPLPASARAVIESGALAHLVTLEPDGRPQVTIVWAGLDGDEIVVGHRRYHRKLRNIANDDRVAISFESGTLDDRGLAQYLVVYGRARVSEGGAEPLLARLAEAYLGPDAPYETSDDESLGYVTHVRVERVSGVGPWARPR